jgi:3-deoxy-D-manno-octulosonic-acid transferase
LAYQQLGAANKLIKTIGNLKLVTAIPDEQISQKNTVSIERDYVLLASTHQNEEQQVYNIWKKLNRPELLLIAPRHPERSASIIKQLDSANIAARSKHQPVTEQTEIFLLDTVGELKNLFKKAKLVIMGGSFVATGGHNILEPASFNKTIITGPYMENFKEELDLMLEKKAIVQVDSVDELEKQLQQLLDNKNLRERLQNNTEKLAHNAEKILEDYSRLILGEN